ncbi:elongation factor P [Candidatus Gottesmanbacteria bacterium RIFCSPHIGHO2_02_FULL_40_24]|uniref:Elongation factor P n=1 Tax=Candidatus Gottesmanbacteria bacterium RIFCSPHIGHO2_01_FULL_40_15 TaxID=1798376 RepID=A0A1F5Z3H1_9BACT|nr:MAG: elongation factor P [Candidatus Gottesmanbacteria bacterium RIFCSPHIGHO2_01_FULL_40_15]OGG17173.1 MAG: elongation factor P [Candidatus Gottesmanbacteria bacterium RIFCSPHIGHO2_02_FULL_40_24]OGG21248.1 MAG: elongation factor P [Candidatus Gottesmanbacteria bacterium RIFCSPLOWO2_01_FULL_40_10]OGG23567.1 MAG: elongation factor P [Candidatus Gottesmanbacteria bacterium RIFCSPHIGHO2_12_FULL_40_13]OGG32207.1 MAG: elongation factor P [Candidatus Gottesmanbacteria bacterium RIFCSPLOWO2_02_FULL_
MAKITTSNFQKGLFIEFKNDIHQIAEFKHVNPGKGSAFVRTKLKNIRTGNTLEFTYKSGEAVKQLPVYIREMQYLYKNNSHHIFMDQKSFEQYLLSEVVTGKFGQVLKEGEIYQVYVHESDAVGIRIPKRVSLKVVEAEEGIKGNTVTGAKKTVTTETGVKVQVPLFIKKGDVISIDPESGEYLERIN